MPLDKIIFNKILEYILLREIGKLYVIKYATF